MNLMLLAAVLLNPADVRISLLDGETRNGILMELTPDTVRISSEGSEQAVARADVLSIEFPATISKPSEEPQLLVLRDGSRISGNGFSLTAKQVSLDSRSLGKHEFPASRIQSLRFQPDNPTLRPQWETFQKRVPEKDLLIVAKRDGTGLDFLAGVVSSVTAEKTDFLLDGETVPVPGTRVYGIVFAAATSGGPVPDQSPGPSPLKIQLADDSQIAASGVSFDGQMLNIETAWGSSLKIPLVSVRQLDLSGSRIQYLSDLASLEERFEGADPEGSLLTVIDLPTQALLFGPRRDVSLERDSPIRLRGKEFRKGLCLHSRTRISWALDARFSAMQAILGIDDEVAFNGQHSVLLRISGDDKVLFEKTILTTEEPIPLKLSVDSVRTLTIEVDYGDGDSTCDWLDLADARLIIAATPSP